MPTHSSILAWQAIFHEIAKDWILLSDSSSSMINPQLISYSMVKSFELFL